MKNGYTLSDFGPKGAYAAFRLKRQSTFKEIL